MLHYFCTLLQFDQFLSYFIFICGFSWVIINNSILKSTFTFFQPIVCVYTLSIYLLVEKQLLFYYSNLSLLLFYYTDVLTLFIFLLSISFPQRPVLCLELFVSKPSSFSQLNPLPLAQRHRLGITSLLLPPKYCYISS